MTSLLASLSTDMHLGFWCEIHVWNTIPGAYPTHGVWAAVLLYLLAKGPGALFLDRWIARRYGS